MNMPNSCYKNDSQAVPRIKICGMKDMESVRIAVGCGADALGFITEVPVNTHRRIDRETARKLVAYTPPFVSTVMVFMPGDLDNALELIEYVCPDAVQVHNLMSNENLRYIRNRTGVKLIKTVNIDANTDADDVLDYISALVHIADAILLDTAAGKKTGGTGITHDWTISRTIISHSPLPVILAGGLHPGNVVQAVKTAGPYGVDTVSGIETDGRTDENKVRQFIKNVREMV